MFGNLNEAWAENPIYKQINEFQTANHKIKQSMVVPWAENYDERYNVGRNVEEEFDTTVENQKIIPTENKIMGTPIQASKIVEKQNTSNVKPLTCNEVLKHISECSVCEDFLFKKYKKKLIQEYLDKKKIISHIDDSDDEDDDEETNKKLRKKKKRSKKQSEPLFSYLNCKNPNELIVLIGIGIFVILVLDLFIRIGRGLK